MSAATPEAWPTIDELTDQVMEELSPAGMLAVMANALGNDLWALNNDKTYQAIAAQQVRQRAEERNQAAIAAVGDDEVAARRLRKQYEIEKTHRKKFGLGQAVPFPTIPLLRAELEYDEDGAELHRGWAVSLRRHPRPSYPHSVGYDVYEAVEDAQGRSAVGKVDSLWVTTYSEAQPPRTDIQLPEALAAHNTLEDATYLTLDLIMLARQAIQAQLPNK